MVLINGIKYACERCIRGHRVTTCTHTDQPLMMIKPKGRPSTSCEHCKNARKAKNQHQKCLCSNKVPGQHEITCPCNYDETCTCQKTSHKKKTTTVHTPLKKQNSTKKKQQPLLQQQQQQFDNSDYSLLQRSNMHNLENNNNSNDNFQSFDMTLSGGSISSDLSNIPNSSHSNSVASNLNMLSQQQQQQFPQSRINNMVPDYLIAKNSNINTNTTANANNADNNTNNTNNTNNNNNNNNNIKIETNSNSNSNSTPASSPSITSRIGEFGQQGRIGMDYLNDFKPTTSPSSNFQRIGEVTVPIDEYVQPMQQMTDNLNNLLSSSITKKKKNGIDDADNNDIDELEDEDKIRREKFFGDIPVPFSGNGLLDIFQDNTMMTSLNESTASLNSLKFKSKSPTTISELSPSNTGNGTSSRFPPSSILGHSATNSSSSDSMFPLFQAQSNDSNNNNNNAPLSPAGSLSSTSDLQHQHQQQQQQSTPHHLHHHYHQLPPHHSNHQHAHYQSHFSPYPLTKRSESFLSNASSSTNTAASDSFSLSNNNSYSNSNRPPFNQSTDSLVSLHQQQTLTNDNYNDLNDININNFNNTGNNGVGNNNNNNFNNFNINNTPSPIMSNSNSEQQQQQPQHNPERFDSLDLFDGNSIDSFLNKTHFNH